MHYHLKEPQKQPFSSDSSFFLLQLKGSTLQNLAEIDEALSYIYQTSSSPLIQFDRLGHGQTVSK